LFDNGCIKIIDRKKNIFKLSHGEYITPDRIEAVYSSVPCVSQMFVYGHSEKVSFKINPNLSHHLFLELLSSYCRSRKGRIKNTCSQKPYYHKFIRGIILFSTIKKEIFTGDLVSPRKSFYFNNIYKVLDDTAKEAGLKGFEKIKNVYFEPNPFTIENNLLTPTFKLKRIVATKVC
jgi:long-chain acyl-CoA synthetase